MMEELEVGSTIVEYLAIGHSISEAANDGLDKWISASFAVILLGYFAPERLRPRVTALIVSLYSLYTLWIISNAVTDNIRGIGILRDASELATLYELELNSIAAFDTGLPFAIVLPIFVLGLFFGTNGFLIACCIKNLKSERSKSTDDS